MSCHGCHAGASLVLSHRGLGRDQGLNAATEKDDGQTARRSRDSGSKPSGKSLSEHISIPSRSNFSSFSPSPRAWGRSQDASYTAAFLGRRQDCAVPACIGYELSANFDLDGQNWQPIGSEDAPFNATFDGKGYTISNPYYRRL